MMRSRMSVEAFAVVAAGCLLAGCSSPEPTKEDKIGQACTDVLRQDQAVGPPYGPDGEFIGSSEANLLAMSFADVNANLSDSSSATEVWAVEGVATAEWEKRVSTTAWDDDGEPDPLPSVTKRFSCEVGYRTTDDAIVVFEYMVYHPTSGGGAGKVLIEREGADK